jgi:hypothetical protein
MKCNLRKDIFPPPMRISTSVKDAMGWIQSHVCRFKSFISLPWGIVFGLLSNALICPCFQSRGNCIVIGRSTRGFSGHGRVWIQIRVCLQTLHMRAGRDFVSYFLRTVDVRRTGLCSNFIYFRCMHLRVYTLLRAFLPETALGAPCHHRLQPNGQIWELVKWCLQKNMLVIALNFKLLLAIGKEYNIWNNRDREWIHINITRNDCNIWNDKKYIHLK